MKKIPLIILVIIVNCTACGPGTSSKPSFDNTEISRLVASMTDIMVHDVTNPPLAARFFSYTCLAGYEIISKHSPGYRSMHRVLKDFPDIKVPDSIRGYSYQLSALLAMSGTAKVLQPSGKLLEAYEQRLLDSCLQAGCSASMIENSKRYASFVSKKILAYAKSDAYNKISNYPRYSPIEREGSWYPTPPAFLAAVEPYFNKVRPFTLDSASQFRPDPPVRFSSDPKSGFYRLMMQNYSDSLTPEHREIAAFWDCNPFAVQDNGHLLVGIKKISPGAHWLGITGIACKDAKKSFTETLKIYTVVSIGLMDGFICCWDEKYRSNRIRPETAIRKYVDATWQPLLQTPPFPEYLSGHATISAASATLLTHYFGENFRYTDSVEIRYGLEARTFSSFRQAAEEAAVSRFYGGIHFMDAIENGVTQGTQVAEWVLKTVERHPGRIARRQP